MSEYKIYVNSSCFGTCMGWYSAYLFMKRLQRRYKNYNVRVWKEKQRY